MNIVLLTGLSGVGKSAIARQLAERFGAACFSERDVFRTLARGYGFERGRLWLAAVGILEALRAVRERTIDLIAGAEDALLIIVDGVYEATLPAAIASRFPSAKTFTVAVEAPEVIRHARCAERMGGIPLAAAVKEADFLDRLKHEAGMALLAERADLVIENASTLEGACERMTSWIATTTGLPIPQAGPA